MKFHRYILLCSVTAFIGFNSPIVIHANDTAVRPVSVTGSDTENSIKTPVVNLYRILSQLQQSKQTPAEKGMTALRKVLNDSYDFSSILSSTVGYRYDSYSEAEKEQLLQAFTNYTVARYYSSFAKEKGTGFKILPNVKNATTNDDKIIKTRVGDASDMGSATEINYLLRKTPQGWKIVDVLLNGHISQIAIQHGDFSSTLAKGGSQGLIEMLNKKTQSFMSKNNS